MRKITVLSMISLDAVLQAPGGPEEDPANGFQYGGWVAPYSDEVFNEVVREELKASDYLLGRKTFEIWANYWPQHDAFWPEVNTGMKYVFSQRLQPDDQLITGWKNSALVQDVEAIRQLKASEGRDLQVWGSSRLAQLLFENDLVDEMRLKIYPLTLGKGKKLFEGNNIPAAFELVSSIVTSKGVIIVNYKRAGEVKTGKVGI